MEKVFTLTAEKQFDLSKERFNTHQGGYGYAKSYKDKARNRNSKVAQRERNALRAYLY